MKEILETLDAVTKALHSITARLDGFEQFTKAQMAATENAAQRGHLLTEMGKHHTLELAAIRSDIAAIKETMKPGPRH